MIYNVTDASPARNAFAVTPHNTDPLPKPARALWVGGEGTLKVTTINGDTVTFVGAFGLMPVAVSHVFDTGTDASDILGLY